jgi:hypothetical protein
MKIDKEIPKDIEGYNYTTDKGIAMVEHHIDNAPKFQKDQSELQIGGSLSVRKPINEKPLIIFGQDECIYKQYKFSESAWCLPDGCFPLIPKDEGHGVMISTFVSREFGFGMTLSQDQLDLVNGTRVGKAYIDEESAIKKGEINSKTHSQSPHLFIAYNMVLIYKATGHMKI